MLIIDVGSTTISPFSKCTLPPISFNRPIDQHIKGFEALGAEVTNEQGAIYLRAERLRGARIYLDVVSVGATINIMLAAVLAEGKTIIENAAKEPEIIDVATLLTSMGGPCNHKCPGFNSVRNDRMLAAVQFLHAVDSNHIGARTFDFGAHACKPARLQAYDHSGQN